MGFLSDIVKGAGGIVGGAIGFAIGGPAGAAAGFSLGSAAGGAVAGAEAAQQEQRAMNARQKAADFERWQATMANIRDYQVASTMSLAAWTGSGADLESSGAQGSASAVGSQFRYNDSTLNTEAMWARKYSNRMADANSLRGQQSILNSASSIAGSMYSVIPRGPAPTTPGPTATPLPASQVPSTGATNPAFVSPYNPTPVMLRTHRYGG